MSTGSFEVYPPLSQLLKGGGRPGVEYIYALAKNVVTFEEKGYKMARSFVVRGQPMILMYKGEAIRGADVPGTRPNLMVDKEADTVLGMDKPAKKSTGQGSTRVTGQESVLTAAPIKSETLSRG